MSIPTTIKYGGYDVTPDWMKVQRGSDLIYFNPNDTSQNFTYRVGTGAHAPPSALEEFISQNRRAFSIDQSTGLDRTGKNWSDVLGRLTPTGTLINDYSSSQNDATLAVITGQGGDPTKPAPASGIYAGRHTYANQGLTPPGTIAPAVAPGTAPAPAVVNPYTKVNGVLMLDGKNVTDMKALGDWYFKTPESGGKATSTISNPMTPPAPSGAGPTLPTPGATDTITTHYSSSTQTAENSRTAVETAYKSRIDALDAKIKESEQKINDYTTLKQEGVLQNIDENTKPYRADYEKAQEEKLYVQKNFEANQKLTDELDSLLTEGNDLIKAARGVTGLASIRDPRVNQTISDVTARAGVIQAVLAARNDQISHAYTMIDRSLNAMQADRTDRLNYYKTVYDYYDGLKKDEQAKLSEATGEKKDYLKAQIGLLEGDLKRDQTNADYIKGLLENPDSALTLAQAGVTLNDDPQTVNAKLAKQTYLESRNKTISDFSIKGYSYLSTPAQVAQYPSSQIYTVYDNKGVAMTFWKDPTKSSGTADMQSDLSSMDSAFAQRVQQNQSVYGAKDAYISPQDWATAKHQWLVAYPDKGKEFDAAMSKYRNPDDSYDITL